MSEHHSLDPYPIPKDKQPLYINEPWLLDKSIMEQPMRVEPEDESDNVRIYMPLDLNKKAILRRLYRIIAINGDATEKNEMEYGLDVNLLISQIEIYDRVWYVRHMASAVGNHSIEAIELVREFVDMLENLPDGGAECFPFETIDELRREYLGEEPEE